MRIKFSLFSFVFITLFSGSIFVSFKNYKSLTEQTFIVFDFNREERLLIYDFVKDFEEDFPSITVTTLPIKSMKAFYLFNEGNYKKALELLHSDNANPYIYLKESYLADVHEKLGNSDSVYYYREKAFKNLPSNSRNHTTFFNQLSKKSDSIGLINAFRSIKNKELMSYKNYMINLRIMSTSYNSQLIRIADSLLQIYPDDIDLVEIKQKILVGPLNHLNSDELSLNAEEYFKNEQFKKAIALYNLAIEKNPYKYQNYESKGVCYMKLEQYNNAISSFKKAIEIKKDLKNGKSEFFLGAILLNQKQTDSACIYLRKSFNQGYSNAEDYIRQYCN